MRLAVLRRITAVLAIIGIGYLVAYFLLPRNVLPRLFFLFFVGAALIGLTVWRWTYATLFRLSQFSRRILIVGAGWAGHMLAQALARQTTGSSSHRCTNGAMANGVCSPTYSVIFMGKYATWH